MVDVKNCPNCQAVLPADAPGGMCPKCLLQWGFLRVEEPAPPRNGLGTPGQAFVPPSPAELAGLFPQLEILELLGQGGMGVVYKARQPKLDRLVALKILPIQTGRDPSFAERFTREARALARLSHPHVVAIHDLGEAGGLCFLIMEFVDGVNLRQLMQAGQVRPREALAIVPQVCDALQYAHDQGIVHRDIKPENILLDRKGQVKIADFGLAKLLGEVATSANLTGSGQVMGTPHYMAPEQVQRPLEVDQRADIYSLGVVFYEMLTGELPLGRFAPPSHKAGTDVRLDHVVLRTLEREPDRRYQHISELEADLKPLAAVPPPQATSLYGWEAAAEVGQALRRGLGLAQPLAVAHRGLLNDLVSGACLVGCMVVIGILTHEMEIPLLAFGCLLPAVLLHNVRWTFPAIRLVVGVAVYLGSLLIVAQVWKMTSGNMPTGLYWMLIGLAISLWPFAESFSRGVTGGASTTEGDAEEDDAPPNLSAEERTVWRALKEFEADAGLYLGANLTPSGLHNARKSSVVPVTERILGVLDFTGDEEDCKNSLLFGCGGIYCWGGRGETRAPIAIAYEDFPNRTFVNHGLVVYLGKDEFLEPDLDNSPADCEMIAKLLNALRAAVIAGKQAPPATAVAAAPNEVGPGAGS
jgi:tRNA A-37 threonylcarbamoyl transferase component Bud32